MCRWCVEYGNGNKWYLNPDNYNQHLYEAHDDIVHKFTGAEKNTVEHGIADGFDVFADRFDMGIVSMFTESHHAGQVVPIEDALKVVDMAADSLGNRFLLMHCSCRRYFGLDEALQCLWFEPAVDYSLKERPWETDSIVIKSICRIAFKTYYIYSFACRCVQVLITTATLA